MLLETESNQPSVREYFSNPIRHQYTNFAEGEYEYDLGTDTNLSKYMNENAITEMIKVNSEITKILDKFKIAIKINMQILHDLAKNHLPATRKIAIGIANNLPQDVKANVNQKALAEATTLHDLAKVIIPENIINKAGALNEKEREIMSTHAELSYELLKNTDLDKETLNLIKNHHDNPLKKSNAVTNPNKVEDINLQILSMADIYSALREKRCYKESLTKEKSLEIINEQVKEGKFHPQVYDALVKYTETEEELSNRKSQWKIFNFKATNSLRP